MGRRRLGHGRVFWLYLVVYTLGRGWIELLRIDPATQIEGLRINVITSVVVGLGAFAYFLISARMRPGREAPEALRSTGVAAKAMSDSPE